MPRRKPRTCAAARAEDVDKARKFAVENFASELLAVKDSLEAALAVESPSVENMKDGVELTLKQLVAAFGKFNLHDIDPVGEKFDPHQHQAIQVVESDQPAEHGGDGAAEGLPPATSARCGRRW